MLIKWLWRLPRFYSTTVSNNASPQVDYGEKVIKVAILGVPNSGKSTLINQLMERRVCPASSKVHTTKDVARAICNIDNTQIIFLDTPGIVNDKESKRYKLNQSINAARSCLKNADMIGVIHDVSNHFFRNSLHKSIIQALNNNKDKPSFLILNKIDILKSKRILLELVRILCNNRIAGKPVTRTKKVLTEDMAGRGYDGFSDAFMISALEGDGIESIKAYLVNNAKPMEWLYPEENYTDQEPEKLITDTIRAKLLDFLPQEIPYGLKPVIEHFEIKPDKIVCTAIVICPTDRIMRLVLGAGGGKLHQISTSIRNDLSNVFRQSVSFTIELRTSLGSSTT